MRMDVSQSHQALPGAAALEVAVLVKLQGEAAVGGIGPGGLHVGWCLDHSSSMSEASGVSGLTKLEALKAAVQGTLQLLAGFNATVTAHAFSSQGTGVCRRERLASAAEVQWLAQQIERL